MSETTKQEISGQDGFVVGLLVGLITASLGAYKDTTFEPFDSRKFWRSPIIAACYGFIGANLFKENKSKLLLAAFASTSERITVETWKATTGVAPGKFSWGENLDKGWLYKRQSELGEVNMKQFKPASDMSADEYARTICMRNGEIFWGSEASGDPLSVRLRPSCPDGEAIGIIHSHPGSTSEPSQQDIDEMKRAGLSWCCVHGDDALKCYQVR